VSLIYDGRRSSFFRKELLHALRILDEGHISLARMKGSWAGAMGQLQFMPSTFRHFAVDFDGDGRIDIWESQEDLFASAANHLSHSGWRRGQTWGQEMLLPERANLKPTKFKQPKRLSDWQALGVRTIDGSNFLAPDSLSSVVLPEGPTDRAFLVYDNFRVILRWNRSSNYAISVGHLADRIAGLPEFATGRDAEHEPLSRGEIEEMQRILNSLGFDAGAVDGLPGPRTRTAIRAFQQQHSLPPDGYPEPALLQFMRAPAAALAPRKQL
jgi:membrane-bound lytic murein transglycosylase B